MQIGVLGISFKTAQLAVHEVFARKAQIFFALHAARPWVFLSTCNRTEIYFSGDDVRKIVRECVDSFQIVDGVYVKTDAECLIHLCKVTSGLDSADLLETDITRQVKVAYAHACARAHLPSALHLLFQKAFKVAKAAKNLCLTSGKGANFLQTLWGIAEKELGCLPKQKVLLVGYSKTHQSFAKVLQNKGVHELTFCSRLPSQVQGYKAVDRSALVSWNKYDWISCASQAEQFLIFGQGAKKHLIFDLSVPRGVDPQVATKDVTLWNMEQINAKMQEESILFGDTYDAMHAYIVESSRAIYETKIQHALDISERGSHREYFPSLLQTK